jgi:1,4-dihydroxy-2-naphthoate polyprenyltransferase
MTLRQFFGVVEMRTKVVSVSTLAGATIYALRETGRLDPLVLALTVPAVLFVDMGTTAFNSFFDYWRGVDRGPRLQEADKVLVTEGVPALAAFFIAAACYFVAACLGLVLALRLGAWVLGWGALCLAAGFLYNGGPRPISRTPLGELVAGGFLGTALFLVAFRLQAGGWGARPLLASILAVNNACDVVEDEASGRMTLAIFLGPKPAALLPIVLGAAAYLATIGLGMARVIPLAAAPTGAAAALASIPLYARMIRRGFSHGAKSRNMRAILGGFAIWSLGFVAGLVLRRGA